MRAIEASGLTKVYGGLFGRGHTALEGVDLAVEEGTAFGLIGPNGAGKTTFIKLLLGVVRPSAGAVKVLGGDPQDPAVRAGIGYMPERLHLPAPLSPVQFLASVARLKGLRMREAELQAAVERVGLGAARARRMGGFSKGMRQRVGLAAALLGGPRLLILDEPTDGVDPLGRVEVRRLLAEEHARGATLFLNSHLLAETERVCGEVAILAGGKVVRQGALSALTRAGGRWRVRFAPGVDGAALAALGFTLSEGLHTVEAADAPALNVLLDRARQAGALLLELSAERHDLEQVLAASVKPPEAA